MSESLSWDDALTLVSNTLPLIRENFERDRYILPVVFLVITTSPATKEPLDTPEVAVMPLPVDEAGQVTFPVEAIRNAMSTLGSEAYVLCVMLHGTMKDTTTGEVGPERKFVLVVLEHKLTGNIASWEADLTLDECEVPTGIGEFKRQTKVKITSPLTGVFKDAGKKLN
jgi:hypothetical protein